MLQSAILFSGMPRQLVLSGLHGPKELLGMEATISRIPNESN
jgi:hypothetical protein